MTKATTFKLDPALAAAVDRLAAERGGTRSQILREAVAAYVENAGGGGLELGDLVGVLAGPGDLSTRKAHLDDFGADRPARPAPRSPAPRARTEKPGRARRRG